MHESLLSSGEWRLLWLYSKAKDFCYKSTSSYIVFRNILQNPSFSEGLLEITQRKIRFANFVYAKLHKGF